MKTVLNRLFIFIAALLFLTGANPSTDVSQVFEDYDYSVTFYIKDFSDELNIENDIGLFYTVICVKDEEETMAKTLSNILGKSYTVSADEFDFEKFIKKYDFEIQVEQVLNGLKIYYLYCNFLGETKIVNNKTINMQIAISGEYVVAGCPLILGAY